MRNNLSYYSSCFPAHLLAGSPIRGFRCCGCIPRLLPGAFIPRRYRNECEAITCALAREFDWLCYSHWRYWRCSVSFYSWSNSSGERCQGAATSHRGAVGCPLPALAFTSEDQEERPGLHLNQLATEGLVIESRTCEFSSFGRFHSLPSRPGMFSKGGLLCKLRPLIAKHAAHTYLTLFRNYAQQHVRLVGSKLVVLRTAAESPLGNYRNLATSEPSFGCRRIIKKDALLSRAWTRKFAPGLMRSARAFASLD